MFILEADRELSGLIYLVFDLGIFLTIKARGKQRKGSSTKRAELARTLMLLLLRMLKRWLARRTKVCIVVVGRQTSDSK